MKKNPPPSKSIVPAGGKGSKQLSVKNNGPFQLDEDGQIVPGEYKTPSGTLKVKKIEPAKHYDVLNVARAMNDDFAPKLKKLFDPEREACLEALETGFYYSWRPVESPWDKQDCIRINSKTARCFCKHMMSEHQNFTGDERVLKCQSSGCKCKAFSYVPSRPEEVGEFWLAKRRDFDPAAWRIRCRCKHTHEEHEPHPLPHRCKTKGCGCTMFYSASVCAACDMHWHRHNTVLETEKERKRDGRPVREEWFPFAELPKLCTMAMTGQDTGVQTLQEALPDHLRSPQQNALPRGNNDVYHPPGKPQGPGPSGMGGHYR